MRPFKELSVEMSQESSYKSALPRIVERRSSLTSSSFALPVALSTKNIPDTAKELSNLSSRLPMPSTSGAEGKGVSSILPTNKKVGTKEDLPHDSLLNLDPAMQQRLPSEGLNATKNKEVTDTIPTSSLNSEKLSNPTTAVLYLGSPTPATSTGTGAEEIASSILPIANVGEGMQELIINQNPLLILSPEVQERVIDSGHTKVVRNILNNIIPHLISGAGNAANPVSLDNSLPEGKEVLETKCVKTIKSTTDPKITDLIHKATNKLLSESIAIFDKIKLGGESLDNSVIKNQSTTSENREVSSSTPLEALEKTLNVVRDHPQGANLSKMANLFIKGLGKVIKAGSKSSEDSATSHTIQKEVHSQADKKMTDLTPNIFNNVSRELSDSLKDKDSAQIVSSLLKMDPSVINNHPHAKILQDLLNASAGTLLSLFENLAEHLGSTANNSLDQLGAGINILRQPFNSPETDPSESMADFGTLGVVGEEAYGEDTTAAW